MTLEEEDVLVLYRLEGKPLPQLSFGSDASDTYGRLKPRSRKDRLRRIHSRFDVMRADRPNRGGSQIF